MADAFTTPPDTVLHRSSKAAQMAGIPVATLRVWERRYQVARPALSASGQRLYSGADIQRLALIKQLSTQGHSIGQLAPLALAPLRELARQAGAGGLGAASGSASALRVVVVGTALAARLAQARVQRHLQRPLQLLATFDTAAQAEAALDGPAQQPLPDLVLLHAPSLHPDWLATLARTAPRLAGLPKAVVYGFASHAVCQQLAQAGIALLKEPMPDAILAQWLHDTGLALSTPAPAPVTPVGPRRWSDTQLAQMAALPSTVACECPRHVVELLVQLSHFETYSSECQHTGPADAALHAYLHQVAAGARSHFEAALQRVAQHEGLALPV